MRSQQTSGILLATVICFCALAAHGSAIDVRAQTDRRGTTLFMAAPVEHVGVLAREPMVVQHPDGTLFVSGYGAPSPKLWKSRDKGATWTTVDVGTEADGAIGNSDVDLAVAPDGTLYFASMGYDRKAGVFGEGTHIALGVSTDAGATWSWTMLSKTRFDDRPWVDVAPDGTAHVIWNDGEGVCHAVSQDRGRTWTERPRIHAKGGSSHLAIGPRGDIAVRVVPLSASGNRFDEGVDLIAVSEDGGKTWQKHEAPGRRTWVPMIDEKGQFNPKSFDQPRWVEPIAWDSRGTLYSLWGEGAVLSLGRSADRGKTWTTDRIVDGDGIVFFPYLTARGAGELAATWFSRHSETLQAHVARIRVAPATGTPRVIAAPPFQPDTWRGGPDAASPSRDPGGEYLAVAFLDDGGLAVVSPIQNARAKRFGFAWWRVHDR
jgi:hypothetical protein